MNALFCVGLHCIRNLSVGGFQLWLRSVYSKNSFVYLATICLFFLFVHTSKTKLCRLIQAKRRMQLFEYVFSVLFFSSLVFFCKRFLYSSHQTGIDWSWNAQNFIEFFLKYINEIQVFTQILENIEKLKLNSVKEEKTVRNSSKL